MPTYEERDPFIFQIGFDFGTSSSKVVIRDINIEKAWVFQHSDADDLSAILIPSIVLFDGNTFRIHNNINTFYPKNGLYHLKIALEMIALKNLGHPIFKEYENIFGKNCKYPTPKIAKMGTIFFLSVWLKRIVDNIKNKYSNYGSLKEDQILVNMAIPVEDICNESVCSLFRSVLSTAWKLNSEFIIKSSIEIGELDEYISIINNNSCADKDLCKVYPEVSANIQAFIRSPASSPDQTTIYFFTDVGAGTVDQSVFTFSGTKERKLHYFAGKVFPHGSRSIEYYACAKEATIQKLENWRKVKEKGDDNYTIKIAKNKVYNDVYQDNQKTLHDLQECLPDEKGVTKLNTLREKVRFIFSGGGCSHFPYKDAVKDSFKKYSGNYDPIVTSMPYPDDLIMSENFKKYITRFYVAYGLSFLFDDLVRCSLPSDNKILSNNTGKQKCSCGGWNKNCFRCQGTGIIDE